MEKSIYTREYQVILRLLREARSNAGITQVELAERLGLTQSLVSKIERGDRRLDVIELRSWCKAVGISFSQFISELETALKHRS